MTDILILFLTTSAIFLVADAIMLRALIHPVFRSHLGDGLIDGVRPVPAVLFYLVYMFGLLWFAGLPALESGRPGFAAINGAVLGFIAYGTYELTSWSVMRDWHPRMVALDWAWGTFVTGLAAWGGVVLALMLV
jgi:uncharacterized membrane protein